MSSKKKIDENAVLTELSESRFFRPRESDDKENTPQQSHKSESVDNIVDKQTDYSVDQSANQQVSQPTGRPTGRQVERQRRETFDKSDVLGRPKSFYITKKQDKDLDILVQKLAQKLEGKINQKIDRSLVMRLILESTSITDDQTADMLAKQLVD